MGKIAAFDYGTKRIGFAISDEIGFVAERKPIIQVKNDTDALEKILDIIKKNNLSTIVFGLPLLDGQESRISKKVMELKEEIHANNSEIQIILIDETMSTQFALSNAKTVSYKRRTIDSEAARIILQEYLDTNYETKKI